MEVCAGARDDSHREQLRRLVYGLGCLIAVVAIRNGAELLAADSDFKTIARHAPLRLADPAGVAGGGSV